MKSLIARIIHNGYFELMNSVNTNTEEGRKRKEYYRQQMVKWTP